MSKSLILTIQIIDDATEEVIKTIIKPCETSYGYEVERMFEKIGERMAEIIDPNYKE